MSNYCKRCGVELEAGMEVCPLCGGNSTDVETSPNDTGEYAIHPDDIQRSGLSFEQIYIRMVLLILLVPILVTGIVDLAVSPGLTWAPVVWIAVLAFGFALLNPLLVTGVLRVFFLDLVAVVLLLLGIDRLLGGIGWFFEMGLPLVMAIGIIGAGVVLLVPKVKVLVAIAVIILGVAVICVAIETIVSVFLSGTISYIWSPIVFASTMPAVIFLILFQYTVGRHLDLHRRFHL